MIKNVIPTFQIIGETKLNNDSLRTLFNTFKPQFITSLEEKNKDLSDIEKIIEALGNVCQMLFSERFHNNKEYISIINENFSFLLSHTYLTIVFKDVSQAFVDNLYKLKLPFNISQKKLKNEELKFWLLPTYEDEKELAFAFADTFKNYDNLRNQITDKLKTFPNRNGEKDLECIKRLLPNTYGVDCVVSSDLLSIKQLLKYTEIDDEYRYVLLFLYKELRNKFPNIFSNLVLVNKSGIIIGVDSLKTNSKIWRELSIKEIK